MAMNNKAVAVFLMLNLFAFVSTNAAITCPNLSACVSVLGLVTLQVGQVQTYCCPLLNGLVAADAVACLCTGGLTSLPLVGGVLGSLLPVLNTNILLTVNTCYPKYTGTVAPCGL